MPNNHTPPSSTSSQAGLSPETSTNPSTVNSNSSSSQFRVVRKRNRVPLSCGPCRHRKLKCNRAHPCDNCTKRGDVASCTYASPSTRKKGGSGGTGSNHAGGNGGTPDDMQNRIDRLEGLVLSLMTTGNSQPGATAAAHAVINNARSDSLSTTSVSEAAVKTEGDMIAEEDEEGDEDSEVEQVSRGIGIMKMDNGRTVFASDAHWYAILGEISEVKRYFESHKEDYKQHMAKVQASKADESPGTAFLLQCTPAKDKTELLNAFPTKTNADRLIARYFNAYDPSVHIIHGPSFQRQYDKHWQQPQESTAVWLGVCFAMMTLALQSYHRAGDEPPEYRGKSLLLSHEFRRLTAQALLLADITQPIPAILETLILHVQAEYGRSSDAEPGVLLLVGLAVRLAMRMGYHRDPGPHPQITPFHGEMRRRVWMLVRTIDLLISFQFGLPAMIRSDQCDVELPRNLYDDELHEDMKALPPSRPLFEATPMSYMIAKGKMTYLFGMILERTQSLSNPPSYEETMKFDHELREARATHPALLQMRSFQESARDPANLIMQRLGLELSFLRSLFVLHRSFIGRGRENPRFAYSRRTCIDASMQLLDHQATLHREGQAGGRLKSVKWYISSLTTHDFLLAAMMVCLDLFHRAESERKSRSTGSPASSISAENSTEEQRREQMMTAVEACIGIWDSVRESSMEAYKASIALRVMVEKLKTHQATQVLYRDSASPPSQQSQGRPAYRGIGFGMFPNGTVSDVNTDDLPPEQSAAMTLGMLSSGGMSPGSAFGMSGVSPSQQPPASMAGLLNEPMTERTGLTPGYSGEMGAASPFSQMFGQSGAGSNMMGIDGNLDIDWGAWDSYLQGAGNTGMDPANSMWPMNVDMNGMDGGQNAMKTDDSNGVNGSTGPEGVFMGAPTAGPQNGMNRMQ